MEKKMNSGHEILESSKVMCVISIIMAGLIFILLAPFFIWQFIGKKHCKHDWRILPEITCNGMVKLNPRRRCERCRRIE
jgi:hypothetical protein